MGGLEWYTLDSNLRADEVIEGFNSFIWTERYSAYGDFQIMIPSTPVTRRFYTKGKRLTKRGSYYVATMETIQDATDQNDVKMLTVTGRFLESLLEDRAGIPGSGLRTLTDAPQWDITDTPGNIVTSIFTSVCVTGSQSALDTIPFYHSGTLLTNGNIGMPSSTVHMTLELGQLYDVIKTAADAYNLGFRLVRNGENSQIYFEVYVGSDRSINQTTLDAVVFSPGLDNLDLITKLTSSAGSKTVAYVIAPNGTSMVYAPTADSAAAGSGRRVLFVKADDITLAAGSLLDSALVQRGLAELAKNQEVYQFDGQVVGAGGYVYGTDYNLGDLVTEIDEAGFGNTMIVTEHIDISDKEGERSYPTLALYNVVVPGTWSAATGTWGDATAEWATY